MKTILIAGAAGFVGSHLSEACIHAGYSVIGVDDLSSGVEDNLFFLKKNSGFHFLRIDLTNSSATKQIRAFVKERKLYPETIVALAARKIPRYGGRIGTIRVNYETTSTACELAKTYRAKLIFSSTSDVYGLSKKRPFHETNDVVFGSSIVGRWSYGASKYLGEQLAFGYQEEFQIPIVIARIFGVYGPRQVKGWKGNAVSAFFEQALTKKQYELHGDGQQSRTFLYISDLINGLMAIITKSEANNRIINFGDTEEITMKSLAKRIHRLIHPRMRFSSTQIPYQSFTGRPYQDIRVKFPDISQAGRILGWVPKIPLNQGLQQTALWYKRACR